MSSSNRWPRATTANPCTRCGKPDRCLIATDGNAGHCLREGRTWHAKNSDTNTSVWPHLIAHYREKMADAHLAQLAESTGLPVTAWVQLAPGFATAIDLADVAAGGAWSQRTPELEPRFGITAGRAGFLPDAFAFAEHDGNGRIIGASFRALNGQKGSPSGARRGLIVPTNLHALPDPVLIVEGASDVAACCAMGLAAVGRPSNRAGSEELALMLDGRKVLVVGERDGKPDGAWPGRDGAKAVAKQMAGRWGEAVRWTLPPPETKDIREWLNAKLASGLSSADAGAMGAAGIELLTALEQASKEAKPERRTQADALVDLANSHYRLGISTEDEAFAVPIDGPAVAVMFRGGRSTLRAALAKLYRVKTGNTPSASALADAMVALEGLAADAEAEPLALRLAEHDRRIVLDLGDTSGHVVSAGPDDGVKVLAVSPVRFRRTALTARLPEPLPADPVALLELRNLLNVDEGSWPLVAGWLVAAFMLNIPHPLLILGGEQGTGKSTAARLLAGLADPSPAPLRSEPRDPEQWAIAASGSWIVVLDNISNIPRWLSDALCKAVTGDGLVRRRLYSDNDLAVLSFRRCIIITSIDPGAMRGDLGDRLVLVDLERIPDDHRRTEAELEAAYQAARPRLLGALLSAASRTLAALPSVQLPTMPRMADFARVLAALDAACPELTGGRAFALFNAQRQRIAGEVVESDIVAAAVVRMIEARGQWSGTARDLLEVLTPQPLPRGWPASPRGLSGHLRRVVPALRGVGIEVIIPQTRTSGGRIIRIEKLGEELSQPSPLSPEAANRPESDRSGNTETETAIVCCAGMASRPLSNAPDPELGPGASDGGDCRIPVTPPDHFVTVEDEYGRQE